MICVKKGKKKTFKEDFRKTNPGLHHLHVKFALEVLKTLDIAYRKIAKLHFTSTTGPLIALHNERQKLLKESAAYTEAEEILDMLRKIK